MKKFILDSELLKDFLKKEKEDIWELVREEDVLMLECQRKFFGLEDKEFSEDFSKNTELKVKLTLLCIKSFICGLRVIFIRIRKFLLRLLFPKKLRLKEKSNKFNFRLKEENITRLKEKENSKINSREIRRIYQRKKRNNKYISLQIF